MVENICYYPGIEFHRGRDCFSLLANDSNYKINFIDMSIKVRHIGVNHRLSTSLDKRMNSSDCHLAFQRTQIRAHQLHAGKIDVSIPNLFTGGVRLLI